MNCPSCADLGLIRVPWNNAPDDYAICLCRVGLSLRDEQNAGRWTGYALWQVIASMRSIDPSHVFLMEEILTAGELAERGFGVTLETEQPDREAALLAAGKTRRAKL